MQKCIDRMNPDDRPPEVVNTAIKKIAQGNVYMNKAVELGSKQMKDFEKDSPVPTAIF